ncbi:MAG: flagellar protein FlaG [Parvularculaceae bacterium]
MDVSKANENPVLTSQLNAGAERAAALAEARRQVSGAQVEAERAAQTRRTETIAETRAAIAEALGANTRISITRGEEALMFVYQAIDVNSGEVVQEWPPERFVEFVNSIRPGAGEDVAGLIVDSEA